MTKKIKYFVFDLEHETPATADFDTIDQATACIMAMTGTRTDKELEKYLQSNDCKYEIRTK